MKNLSIKLMLLIALLYAGCNNQDEHLPIDNIRPADEICKLETCTDIVDQISYSDIPIESRFAIEGYYGCIAAFPYSLVICQKGTDVTYVFNDSESHLLNYSRFEKFWHLCSLMDLNLLKSTYGSMASTADFRGHLTIECRIGKGRFFKKIEFQMGLIEDSKFAKLINSVMKMVSKRHRLPIWLGE